MKPLSELLTMPEGKTLEFKRDLSSPKSIIKTIIAFANTAGGSLVLGVEDNKKLMGIADPLLVEEQLTSLIADNILPFLLPTIKIASVENKNVIVIEVPFLANMGPFYFKQEGIEKGVIVRLGSSSRIATPELIQELRRIKHSQSFDAIPCSQTTYKDLDQSLIRKTFENIKETINKAKLKTLKILVPYSDEYIPSNAGIILFGKPEIRERFFPMAHVSCARFSGIDKVDFLDRLDIPGIIEAVDAIPAFIRRNTKMGAIINDIRRKDVPEYPTIAIREGLLNALMHADYSHMNMRIFVSIFDDRLEIRSPGSLPPGMTIEGIKEGISMPRNLVIARIFKMLDLVEQFGTGYRRIAKACASYNYPLPEWKEVGPYTDIIFRPIEMKNIHDSAPSRHQVGTKSAPSRHQVEDKDDLNQEELEILRLCHNAQSINFLMDKFHWKDRTKFRKRFITPLIVKGLLMMTVPEKPNSKLQKYRTKNIF